MDSCSNSGSSQALGCLSGYYLSSGTCLACASNSIQCISGTISTVCSAGQYVSLPYISTCSSGVTGSALNSAVSATVASACLVGYYLATVNLVTVCTSCGTNAASCTNNYVILTCASGYTLVNNFCFPNKLVNIYVTACASGYYRSAYNTCTVCTSTNLKTSID